MFDLIEAIIWLAFVAALVTGSYLVGHMHGAAEARRMALREWIAQRTEDKT